MPATIKPADRVAAATFGRQYVDAERVAAVEFYAQCYESADLYPEHAERVLSAYLQAGVLKFDHITRRYTVKHGASWDRDVLRRAAGLED